MTIRPRIIIAEDHTFTLEGLRTLLAVHYEIVALVADGRALVEETLRLKPDLVILDISMPLLNGIDAAVRIRKELPRCKLLFITMHANPAYLEAALEAGATGYVLKTAAREDLLEAAKQVLQGKIYVSSGLPADSLPPLRDPVKAASKVRLSSREREVLQLIAEGKLSKEIAFHLDISVKTVSFHRENIKRKLAAHSTAELTKRAMEFLLID